MSYDMRVDLIRDLDSLCDEDAVIFNYPDFQAYYAPDISGGSCRAEPGGHFGYIIQILKICGQTRPRYP
jgi:hypothetical protein